MGGCWIGDLIRVCRTMLHDETDIGGHQHGFPTTHWSLLVELRGSLTPAHREVLNLLILRYWKPVYCYLRSRGYKNEQAKDLVQEFFTFGLGRDLFGRADASRGRFRTFLLSCLNNFLKNIHRDNMAKGRRPIKGIISIDDLTGEKGFKFEPSDQETPELVFQRTWARELLLRVLNSFEEECKNTGKLEHYQLFHIRIIEPSLEGTDAPPLREVAHKLGLTEKEAGNRLITARRAYQRLLREEVRLYAASQEDEAAEIRDLFQCLSEA